MTAKVLVIGLDAAEATLLERWAADGILPHLARVIAQGANGRLDNPMETLPGAIWPEIWSGRSCGKLGTYFHPYQIHSGEAALRPIQHDEVDATDNYWSLASDAGRRVCVVDQVQSALNPNLNGVQVLEWGLHDRTFSERSHPSALIEEINGKYGVHPVRKCDEYGTSRKGRQALLDDLTAGSIAKRAMALDLMHREEWDLFACTLAECHCVGHHFWHCFDETSPYWEPDVPNAHRDAIKTVYRQLDETVGALIDAAGTDCTTLIIASHGFGPSRAGYQLLPDILAALGMNSDHRAGRPSLLYRIQNRIRFSIPMDWARAVGPIARSAPIKWVQRRSGALLDPLESSETRAIAVPNNRVGAIRLNIKGRDPFGAVAPGNEATALMHDLRDALLELTDPNSGDPIIETVTIVDEKFGPDHHPDLPDLLVVFRDGYGPIEACRSDRVGLIKTPYYNSRTHRSGDHTVESRLWATGGGIPAGRRIANANVLDIAPTILELLDVPLPGYFDGRPIELGIKKRFWRSRQKSGKSTLLADN